MRNYTSKSQKIDLYSKKYGISKEEIRRILSEHEDLLTLDELKIKYDNMDMGNLPSWLSEEEVQKMIWSTINSMWCITLQQQYESKLDLFNDLYVYVYKKSNLWLNHNHLKGSLILRIQTLIDGYMRRIKYYVGSLDEKKYDNNEQDFRPRYNPSLKFDEDEKVVSFELLDKIDSIKDEYIQNILIITGYIVCNISQLKERYLHILENSSDEVKSKIHQLEQLQFMNDELDRLKIEDNPMPVRKEKITVIDVVKALSSDIPKKGFKSITTTKLKKYFEQYGLLEILCG